MTPWERLGSYLLGPVEPLKLELTRPLIVFDLETTGFDFEKDRIVEIAAMKIAPDSIAEKFHRRVNPGIPIPKTATDVHGITDEAVKDCPTFIRFEICVELMEFFNGCDLAGFNVNFDISFLRAELARITSTRPGFATFRDIFDSWNPVPIDAMEIYRRNERRDLTAAVAFYLKEERENAHSALHDVEYTTRVLAAQTRLYALPNTVEALGQLLNAPPEGFLDKEKKLKWDSDNEVAMNFGGEYEGQKLREMPSKYLNWILSKDFSDTVKKIVSDALRGIYPVRVQNGETV